MYQWKTLCLKPFWWNTVAFRPLRPIGDPQYLFWKNIATSEQCSHTTSHIYQMHIEQILKMQISLYIAMEWEMEKENW